MSIALIEEKVRTLERHSWSSPHGYLTKVKKEPFIDYAMVLDEYVEDTDRARKGYKATLYTDLAAGIEIKDKILGQSIIGRDEFRLVMMVIFTMLFKYSKEMEFLSILIALVRRE